MEEKKCRRKRDKLQKKWTDKENGRLLDYLLENNDIEKPTAHLYYMKLINNTKIDVTPKALRSKVRYLKKTFRRAEEWCQTSGTAIDIGCSSYKRILRRICPYYDQLTQIFSIDHSNTAVATADDYPNRDEDEKIVVKSEVVDDYMEANCTSVGGESSWVEDLMLMVKTEEVDDIEAAASVKEPIQESTWTPALPKCTISGPVDDLSPTGCRQRLQEYSSRNIPSTPAEFFKRRGELYEKRIFIEYEKLNLEKRRLDFEMEKLRKDFEIRRLKLEQKERLALQELKYKYNRK